MNGFHFSLLTFRIKFLESGEVPKHKASAFRGGMGQMLLRMYCVNPNNLVDDSKECSECFCKDRCLVQNIMYTKYKIKPSFVTNNESEGYTLFCSDRKTDVDEDSHVEFTMILYGDTIAYFYPIILAFNMLGNEGLGKEKVPFVVESVFNRKREKIVYGSTIDLNNMLTEDINDYIKERKKELGGFDGKIRVSFKEPCSVKYMGKFLDKFNSEAIVKAASRRVHMMQLFEGIEEEENKNLDFPVIVSQKSRTESVRRYSSRTETAMHVKGLVGTMDLMDVSDDVLDILLAGEITQIGKNTRFGFGGYEIKNLNK